MTPILAPGGKVRGYLHDRGSMQELTNPGGKVLGYYDKLKNQTLRPGGKLVSYGNTLTTLLED